MTANFTPTEWANQTEADYYGISLDELRSNRQGMAGFLQSPAQDTLPPAAQGGR